MTKKTERVFIRGARLSFPSLDAPRATMADGNGASLKYQATFLLEPSNPSLQQLRAALMSVASAMWGDRAAAVLKSPDKNPLKSGDAKERVPEGYAGMLYIAARSRNAPELRDANPHVLITDPCTIREKFVAGYKVNAFVDLYPYEIKNDRGAVIKSGIAAGLVAVQFCAYADTFSGVSKPTASDFPDCSSEAEQSGAMDGVMGGGYPQAPQQRQSPVPTTAPGYPYLQGGSGDDPLPF